MFPNSRRQKSDSSPDFLMGLTALWRQASGWFPTLQVFSQVVSFKSLLLASTHILCSIEIPHSLGFRGLVVGSGLVSKLCPTLVTPWNVACQTPLFSVHGISKQEYWSGLPFPSPGNRPDPGIKPWSLALQVDSLLSHQGRPSEAWGEIFFWPPRTVIS